MLPRKFKMPPKAWRQGCRIQDRLDSNGKEGYMPRCESLVWGAFEKMPPSSPDALNPAALIGWHVNTQAALLAHTRSHMLHLAETERKREGQLMREVEGGAAVLWENERLRAQAARGVEKKWREMFSDRTGSISFWFLFTVLFLFMERSEWSG